MPAANRYATLLAPWRLRLARSPLPAFGRRASAALLSLLPARWRARLADDNQRVYLLPNGDELALVATGSGGDRPLGHVPLDDAELLRAVHARLEQSRAPRWLLLPAAQVLRRTLTLPAAAEARLRDVLAFELDRQTPFSADQVSYEGRVLARDLATQQLQVELAVLPRARLDAQLQALGALAPGLSGVDVADAAGQRQGYNLLPEAQRDQRLDPVRRLNLILAAVALFALLATLLLTLHNRSVRLEWLRQEVAAANEQARDARLLRNQLQTSAQAANFLATRRASRPTMLELVNELTQRIPDDTTLDKLTVNDGAVVMVGLSSAAPALVGLLQQSPLLEEPALSGAVQADPRAGRDRFTLTARIALRGEPEAADASRP
ncbi:MAG: PilN domain-containing protein [Arenimonas sp.]|nr:PilN domain-containing protein [Arenimonas sp.]